MASNSKPLIVGQSQEPQESTALVQGALEHLDHACADMLLKVLGIFWRLGLLSTMILRKRILVPIFRGEFEAFSTSEFFLGRQRSQHVGKHTCRTIQ